MERAELDRLRWHCTRRGLLELDLTLGRFLEEVVQGLSREQIDAFTALIARDDHELWGMITGRQECPEPQQAELIALMRKS